MPMEDENLCSSLPDITDSVIQQPQRDSWTSIDRQYTNGEQQVQSNHSTDQLRLSPKAGRDSPEEAQQWEQIVWPVRHMTCTSPLLSFATVQWDMPDPSAEMSSLMTDSSVANELSFGCVTNLDTTSPLLPQSQDVSAELFTQEVREEEDGFDSGCLNSNLERTGSGSEPCDAADAQDPPAQEKEDSSHELLDGNNDIPLAVDSEEEEGHSATSDPVGTVDIIDIFEEIEGSQIEQTSHSGLETEEENEVGGETEEEQQSLTNLSCSEESEEAKSCLSAVEVPALPPQTDDTGPTANPSQVKSKFIYIIRCADPDKLIDLQQHTGSREDTHALERLQEDPTGQIEESEMCKDETQTVDPKQSDSDQPLMQAADNAERTENSQEILELTKEPEETSCLQHQHRDHMTSQELRSKHSESEQLHMREEGELNQGQHLEQSTQMELTGESFLPENADLPEERAPSEQTVCVEAEDPGVAEQREQTEPSEQNEQTTNLSQPALSEQLVQPETDESELTEQLSTDTQITEQLAEAEFNQVNKRSETSHEAEEAGGSEGGSVQGSAANGEHPEPTETAKPLLNGHGVDRETARHLAEQLFKLEGIQRVDVVKHLDKDNDFSRAVGEEYLKFFDFTGLTLDHALRSFLKVVVLIGETQERERVLQHFACRFHQCNPDSFSSSDAVLALTCALMLLNTDLHGQNVGKTMSSSKFVSNLDEMNEGGNFDKELLKSLYNSIKNEPLEWAIDEEELKNSVLMDEDVQDVLSPRSKANPFQDVPHERRAPVVKEGFLQRKLHADVDGKRTLWGKRRWKTFYGVLKGMVLYLQKDDYKRDQLTNEEVVSVHHSLAEQAADYTKKPHVLRLQTADRRVFLFQASSSVEMASWMDRINLVSALHSSPPFPAAVGSQRRFFRPILPALQSAHTMERQLQSHSGMLESFKKDLSYLQKNPPEGKKAKAKELQEHRLRAEYLQHEVCRYETYIQVLGAWKSVKRTDDDLMSITELMLFDKAMCDDSVGEMRDEDGLKKSHSSPSLEMLPTAVIKVRRNISERRPYRRPVIPRWNKDD